MTTIESMAHPLVVEQSRAIPVAPGEAFAKTMPMDLVRLFDRWYGPIPPIKAVHDQAGAWDSVGETRIIELAGGGRARETLTTVDVPGEFGYLLNDIAGPMALLIDHVDGTWLFEPAGTGTKVTWRWALHAKSALTAPALPAFGRLWRSYAARSLDTLSNYLLS